MGYLSRQIIHWDEHAFQITIIATFAKTLAHTQQPRDMDMLFKACVSDLVSILYSRFQS